MVTLAEGTKNRLLIFFFEDKDGVVDQYIPHMLGDLKKNVSEILVVANGKLSDEGRLAFEKLGCRILVRENQGFDVLAYQAGIAYYGWDKLAKYDELIMMDFTIMGPLYPFSEMFAEMDARDVDFWGLTLHHNAGFDPLDKNEHGPVPFCLDSHWIAVRKRMFMSAEYREYWESRPVAGSYEEAAQCHEAVFTQQFEGHGFTWDVYVDTRDLLNHSSCPLLFSPLELVKNRKCPIVKRQSFFLSYGEFLRNNNGESTIDLFEYIKEHSLYDVALILENIMRTQNQANIKKCLHFNYVLPSNVRQNAEPVFANKKIALILHIYYEDLIEYCFGYASSMPETSHIYVTTNSQTKKELIEAVFHKGNWAKVDVMVIQNRGRSESALLLGTKDFVMGYDYVCFAHDKKSLRAELNIRGEAFSYKCFENVLKNKIYVENIIYTFEENPRLGLLAPPPPNFADLYPLMEKDDWGPNYENTRKLAERLGLTVDLDPGKEPIAPFGTMFWFRPKAMEPLFAENWEYTDFPSEPMKEVDGTILHAIERIYPFVVQQEGYYPAWVMADTFARIEVTNLYYMLRELTKASFSIYGSHAHAELVRSVKDRSVEPSEMDAREVNAIFRRFLKEKIKRSVPKRLWLLGKKIYRK